MSIFSNIIGISNSNIKILKLSEKQVLENDYERLRNKFNFSNIKQNKNVNSFPLRLSSPNYKTVNSKQNSTKYCSNNEVNSHKISHKNYANENYSSVQNYKNIENTLNYTKINNKINSNHKRSESRYTITTNNFYKQDINSISKENILTSYNIKQSVNSNNTYLCSKGKNSSSNKELSSKQNIKKRKITHTHASTDFRFSDKSIDISSNNNSFISHSFINNINNVNNRHISLKNNEKLQQKIEGYNSNGTLSYVLTTCNSNFHTNSQKNFVNNKMESKALFKNKSQGMINNLNIKSNITPINNFNKINNLKLKSDNTIDHIKNNNDNNNSNPYKKNKKGDIYHNRNSYNPKNKCNNAAVTDNSSIIYSVKETPSNYNKIKDDNHFVKNSEFDFNIVNTQKISGRINDYKNIDSIQEKSQNKQNSKRIKNDIICDKNSGIIDSAKNNYYKNKSRVDTGNGKLIKDETERKSERNCDSDYEEENNEAFANALDDLSQSNESSINELIKPLNKKMKTISSQNIPSEENVDSK